MKRIAFLVLTLCLAFAGDSWGRQRTQPARHEAAKAEQTANPNQRGTPEEPLTVNVVPTPEQKAEAEKKEIEAKVKAADDHKLVEYAADQVVIGVVTFGIFLLQLAAFVAQAIFMRRTVIEARRTTHASIRSAAAAQKSARISERALTDIERPYIFVFGMSKLIYVADGINSRAFVKFKVANFGRLPAIIEEASAGFVYGEGLNIDMPLHVGENDSLVVFPILQQNDIREVVARVADGMLSKEITVEVPVDYGFSDEAEIIPKFTPPDGSDTFFRIILRYRGPISQGHETNGMWLYEQDGNLVQRGDAPYNQMK